MRISLFSHVIAISFILLFTCAHGAQTLFDSNSPDPKYVVAHFIVGNTYPYTIDNWLQDIDLASSKGIDAFALNIGSDYWQRSRVADAFAAANKLGKNFKLFISFDMGAIPCSNFGDAYPLRDYITTYQSHPNQLTYNGQILVSTFSGENCRFGTSNINEGWTNALKTGLPPIHFIPSFFVDPSTFTELSVMDGSFNWNSAWPMGNCRINNNSDIAYIDNLGGKSYMAGVSPWFFTHYGPDTYNKNFIYRGDDWLFIERWEMLVQNRDSIGIAQVISWNDFGESHYVGPIAGAQPHSEAWTTDFDHQGWLDLIQYFATAFKTGDYPTPSRDRIFLWARLYPVLADAPDAIGKPRNWEFTEDYLWAAVLLTSPAQVCLSCGSSTITQSLPTGLSKLRLPLVAACSVKANIQRGLLSTLTFEPAGFAFSEDPPSYNFNAYVVASP